MKIDLLKNEAKRLGLRVTKKIKGKRVPLSEKELKMKIQRRRSPSLEIQVRESKKLLGEKQKSELNGGKGKLSKQNIKGTFYLKTAFPQSPQSPQSPQLPTPSSPLTTKSNELHNRPMKTIEKYKMSMRDGLDYLDEIKKAFQTNKNKNRIFAVRNKIIFFFLRQEL